MIFDIIGDIHGYASKLEYLLKGLGYEEKQGVYSHSERKAIFVGDLIDRGPEQMKTIDIVYKMVTNEHAFAVMGNHEFNAIAYSLFDKDKADFLRPRLGKQGHKNYHQHQEFLKEVGQDTLLHKEKINWFLTLPVFLELEDFKIIHACWHQPMIEYAQQKLKDGKYLTEELMYEACKDGKTLSMETKKEDFNLFMAMETLMKGIELDLPNNHSFVDPHGITRKKSRIAWWDMPNKNEQGLVNIKDLLLLPDSHLELLPNNLHMEYNNDFFPKRKPVFFGHYWREGETNILNDHCICVDYSAGKGKDLVCYSYDTETKEINNKNFNSTKYLMNKSKKMSF